MTNLDFAAFTDVSTTLTIELSDNNLENNDLHDLFCSGWRADSEMALEHITAFAKIDFQASC